MKIYGDIRSGNCYKVKLVAELLGLEYEWVHVDIMQQQTHTDAFLALNPNAKIPIIELADGRVLSESNAIINYLAMGTSLLPDSKFEHALVQQWQFFEQYSHEPYIAVARYIALYLGLPEDQRARYDSKQAGGHKALAIMDKQLAKTTYLVGNTFTTADIALYAYTHVANEGGFDLAEYQHIQRWLQCVAEQPSFIPMA